MEEKRFYAKWSSDVRFITHGFAIVCLLVFFFTTADGFSVNGSAAYLPLGIILLGAWVCHPKYYILTPTEIVVKRPWGNIIIPMSEIDYVRSLTKEDLGFSIRLFASGGLFGHFGLYNSKNMGNYSMWCTNKEDMVMLKMKNGKSMVLSPSDSTRFIEMTNDYIGSF